MYEKFILHYPNSLQPDFCKHVIDKFEKDEVNQYPGITRTGVDVSIKKTMDLMISNKTSWKNEDEVFRQALQTALNRYYKDIPPQYKFQDIFATNIQDRGYQIQKYTKNDGFYIWHNDMSVEADGSFRILTFLWYLNDVEEGGETEFSCNMKVKPETGKLVIFPATWGAIHRGCMPISHDKYIVTGWIYTRMIPPLETEITKVKPTKKKFCKRKRLQ